MIDITKIAPDDVDFPPSLKKIPQPIKVLYFRGDLPKNNELCFGIVGARRCSDYGKQAALEFTIKDGLEKTMSKYNTMQIC